MEHFLNFILRRFALRSFIDTMRKIIIGIIITAGSIAGMLFLFGKTNEDQRDVLLQEEQQKIPDIALQDTEGNEVRLRDFAGTLLIIHSWAIGCPFCKEGLADLVEAQREFGNKIKIIAIDRAESREKIKEFTDSRGVTDNLLFLLDPSDSFYRAIGGFSMPETIFVDTDSFIKDHKRGLMSTEEIRRRIRRAFST